jgi:UrcA family protein
MTCDKRGTAMNTNATLLPVSALALATMLTMGTHAARAQAPAQGSIEEIVVEAPWKVETKVVSRSPSGVKIEEISLKRRVDYSDLDLTRTADVMELEKRITDVAKDSCMALERMYPLADANTQSCVKDAVSDAMKQEREAVAAAEAKGENKEVAEAPR